MCKMYCKLRVSVHVYCPTWFGRCSPTLGYSEKRYKKQCLNIFHCSQCINITNSGHYNTPEGRYWTRPSLDRRTCIRCL